MRRIAAFAAAGLTCVLPGAARRRTGAQSAPAPNARGEPGGRATGQRGSHLGTITADPDIDPPPPIPHADTSTADTTGADTTGADTTGADAWTRPADDAPARRGNDHDRAAQVPPRRHQGHKADAAAPPDLHRGTRRSPQLVMAGRAWPACTRCLAERDRARSAHPAGQLHPVAQRPATSWTRSRSTTGPTPWTSPVLRLRPRPAGPDVRRVTERRRSTCTWPPRRGWRIEDGAAPARPPHRGDRAVAEVRSPARTTRHPGLRQHNTADAHPVRWDAAKPIAPR